MDHPLGKQLLGVRIKYKVDGTIESHKGFTQIEGIDFFENFSPVAKLNIVHLLLALSPIKGWYLEQLVVNNTFLHRDLHEVYMELPPRVTPSHLGQVCRLCKSLYGLRQASRQWYEKLSHVLIFSGYVQSQIDNSLFTKVNSIDSFTAILTYVDDMILMGNDFTEITRFKK